jgi:DNA invertase Pin-like site-specific DNA recombinase
MPLHDRPVAWCGSHRLVLRAFKDRCLIVKGAFAEFERNIIRKRQAEGIAKGVYKETKKRIDRERVHQLCSDGNSTYQIA